MSIEDYINFAPDSDFDKKPAASEPPREALDTRIEAALQRVEQRGCSCDVMTGWSCGVHEDIKELRAVLAARPRSGEKESK